MRKSKTRSTPRPARTRKRLRIGIVGTGGMANMHAEAFSKIPGCELTAACDVDADRAAGFARQHGIPDVYSDLGAMLAAGRCDAVSVVTPDAFHASVSLDCLRAGLHVLCEKPLATNQADAARMAAAAKKAGVANMVNFSYRNSAAVQHLARRIAAGDLGRVLHVDGHYYQDWLCADHWGAWKESPAWLWRLSTSHGSKGVLGDIGVHLLDFASFPVGPIESVRCLLKTFPKAPGDRIGEYLLDANDSAVITATFAGGAVGTLQTTRWATGHRNSVALAIYGEEGSARIDLDRSYSQMEICRIKNRKAGPWRTITCNPVPTMYERFARSALTGRHDQPDFARGAEIQRALDACEKSHSSHKTIKL